MFFTKLLNENVTITLKRTPKKERKRKICSAQGIPTAVQLLKKDLLARNVEHCTFGFKNILIFFLHVYEFIKEIAFYSSKHQSQPHSLSSWII